MQSYTPKNTLISLPRDTIHGIASYLPISDISRFTRSNRQIYSDFPTDMFKIDKYLNIENPETIFDIPTKPREIGSYKEARIIIERIKAILSLMINKRAIIMLEEKEDMKKEFKMTIFDQIITTLGYSGRMIEMGVKQKLDNGIFRIFDEIIYLSELYHEVEEKNINDIAYDSAIGELIERFKIEAKKFLSYIGSNIISGDIIEKSIRGDYGMRSRRKSASRKRKTSRRPAKKRSTRKSRK
jgi:hypothetical protein